MKKLFLPALMLAVFMLVSSTATAGEIIYHGDYAFTLQEGKATIVDSNYNRCAPTWDDLGSYAFERLGLEDESALFPESCDANGVWRTVVPSTLGGHPVIAIGDSGLDTSMRGDVVLPEGLTSIGAHAFAMCVNADAITIPASVKFIGKDAFSECPATLRVIEGSYAAQYAQENDIPYTYDLEYAVFQSGDWRYTLAGDTATIYDCDGYMYNQYDDDGTAGLELAIPEHLDGYPVVAIKRLSSPYDTLYNSGRVPTPNSIFIPAGVTKIEGNPFTSGTHNGVSASKLTKITVSPDNPVFESVDGVLFNKQENKLVAFPGIRAGKYSIPEGVTAVGDQAFELCSKLTNVIIPDSVTEIGPSAFSGCEALTNVTIPASVTEIGPYAFYGCEALTDVSIPSGVTRISDKSFYGCTLLSGVTIPEGVASIGESAFDNCLSIYTITFPSTITEIMGNPFVGCRYLTEINVSPSNSFYESMDGVLFDKRQNILVAFPSKRTGDYLIPRGVTVIGEDAFNGCKGLTDVTIPQTVTSIGDRAFYRCERLTSVVIPEGVTAISDSAFAWCEDLGSVTIPESVTHIGDEAFMGCKRLANLIIPRSVMVIGDYAFHVCDSLTSVLIPESVTYIGYRAFSSSGITSIVIPGSVTVIGDAAFGWCDGLTNAVIEEGIVYICNEAFIYCGNLTSVSIPDSVTSIGYSAFYGCERLKSVTIPASITGIGTNAFDKPFGGEPVVLSVIENSYAEHYAEKNGIPHTTETVEK